MSNGAWECPKCGYAWSGAVIGRQNCNRPEHEKYTTSTTTTLPPDSSTKKEGL